MPGRYLGIDIGSTKTHLRFYDEGGIARDLLLPTVEWRVHEWEKDAAALLMIARGLTQCIGTLAVGASGCDDVWECGAFQSALFRRAGCPVLVVNNAELLPAALGDEHEVGLVAGTSSIAAYRDGEVGMLVSGGLDWVIGDDGGAAGLVREAGRAICHHLDHGGSMSEPLAQLMFEALEIPSAQRIGSVIAQHGSGAALGHHAPLLFEAERRGSLLARQVIRHGARHLAELVVRLKSMGAKANLVIAGGGVISSQPTLAEAFRRALARRLGEQVTSKIYFGPPVEGACRLAASLVGSNGPVAAAVGA